MEGMFGSGTPGTYILRSMYVHVRDGEIAILVEVRLPLRRQSGARRGIKQTSKADAAEYT